MPPAQSRQSAEDDRRLVGAGGGVFSRPSNLSPVEANQSVMPVTVATALFLIPVVTSPTVATTTSIGPRGGLATRGPLSPPDAGTISSGAPATTGSAFGLRGSFGAGADASATRFV